MLNDINASEPMEENFRLNRLKLKNKIKAANDLFAKIKKLKIPPVDPKRDLIAEYYEAMGKKHGCKGVSRRKRNT
jgi:hypothetical protein